MLCIKSLQYLLCYIWNKYLEKCLHCLYIKAAPRTKVGVREPGPSLQPRKSVVLNKYFGHLNFTFLSINKCNNSLPFFNHTLKQVLLKAVIINSCFCDD